MTLCLSRSTRCRKFRSGVVCLFVLMASECPAQQIRVEAKVEVSPSEGGWYPWYEIAADPTDPNNLIACGSKWDSRENAFYGFVYSSSDGGNTWRIALEDKNTTWVTEHSCAFGVNGKVYFISEAAHIVEGMPSMDDLGVTRIVASNDHGLTWAEAAKTRWADYSTSVVERNPGPDQNRLYTFFNYLPLNTGDAVKDLAEGNGERVALITFKDGDKHVEGPVVNRNMGLCTIEVRFPTRCSCLRMDRCCPYSSGVAKPMKG